MIAHDAFFAKGGQHAVCQDYALSGALPHGRSYAVLADGCSGSPHTEFGASLLCHAIRPYLAAYGSQAGTYAIEAARSTVRGLRIPPKCLDATLLWATHNPETGFATACITGDGVVLAQRWTGELETHHFSHPGEAPYYLSYLLDAERERRYRKEHGHAVQYRYWDGTTHKETWKPAQPASPFLLHLEHSTYRLLVLCSDGISTFTRPTETGQREAVPLTDVAHALLGDLRLTKGAFLQRRARAFARFCTHNEWTHYDDISLAGFAFDRPVANGLDTRPAEAAPIQQE